MRRLSISLFSLSLVLLFAGNLRAEGDPPHSTGGDTLKAIWTKDSNKNVTCAKSCHVAKEAQATGPKLTIKGTNPELCMICHLSGSLAAGNLPFGPSDQAEQTNKTGTSHRWDRSMNAGAAPLNLVSNDPNNKYGLKTYETLDSSAVKTKYLLFGAVTCSTCHQQHYQSINPWDPAAGGLYKSPGAASGGTNKTIIQTGAGWAPDQWKDFYVRIISGGGPVGNMRLIKTNTADTLEIYATLLSTDPNAKKLTFNTAVTATNTYIITSVGNHFMRVENKAGEMCEYCHAYRKAATSGTDVRTYDGTKKSHPVAKNLTSDVTNPNQFVGGTAPLEPLSVFDANGDIIAQTGLPRYHQNGGTDTNLTNNIVLDSNSRVRCMSCHGIHYKDSDSSTAD